MASVTGNYLAGPKLDIVLSYDPSNKADQGFGAGWSLGWTSYETNPADGAQPIVQLNTGDSYKTDDDGRPTSQSRVPVSFLQNKLIAAQLHKAAKDETNEDSYILQHKSGEITILTGPSKGGSLKVPKKIYAPSGQALHFDIAFKDKPMVTGISDDSGVQLVSIDYSNAKQTKVTIWPGSSEEVVSEFNLQLVQTQQGNLYQLTGVELDELPWTFEYDSNNDYNLSMITSPLGYKESAKYAPDAILLPANAAQVFGRETISAVVEFTQDVGGGQPPIYTSYIYQNKNDATSGNYLGYNSKTNLGSWSSDHDNLYYVESTYNYVSTIKFYDNRNDFAAKTNPVRVQTLKYNKFHLMTESRDDEYVAGKVVTTVLNTTEYKYCDMAARFEDLDARFQCPTQQAISYINSDKVQSDPEVTHLDYDTYGNLTARTDPDGTSTTWEYYGQAGEDSDEGTCPAAPIGIPTFMKSQTVTPVNSAYDDAPVRKVVYGYKKLSLKSDAPVDYAVVQTQETHFSDKVKIQRTDIAYKDQPGTHLHGRLYTVKRHILFEQSKWK
ncbi:RHS repeat protein [Ochrobactrum haematophilum]|uniref:RHS repeat protein n=1 Tax=Brucella haematophila TaxID=419474 RepID=A0ABX1DL70_9HYPH|nr:RHS repeat protein [Brucella haematophila]